MNISCRNLIRVVFKGCFMWEPMDSSRRFAPLLIYGETQAKQSEKKWKKNPGTKDKRIVKSSEKVARRRCFIAANTLISLPVFRKLLPKFSQSAHLFQSQKTSTKSVVVQV